MSTSWVIFQVDLNWSDCRTLKSLIGQNEFRREWKKRASKQENSYFLKFLSANVLVNIMEGELRVTCDNSDKLWYLDSHVKFYIWKNSSSLVIGRDALDQSDCRLYGSWKYNISQMHLKNSKLVGIGLKCLKITIPKYLKMIWYLKKMNRQHWSGNAQCWFGN